MAEMILSQDTINHVKRDVVRMIESMDTDIKKIILYGSCARGNFTDDSDIDIALLTGCGRLESKKYAGELARIATELAMRYFVVVNFVCLPYTEFEDKKSWYQYFKNIENEGVVLYG